MRANRTKNGQKYEISSKNYRQFGVKVKEKSKNIWEDEEGSLATEPIDHEINSQSNLLQSLQIVMQIKEKVRPVSDLAF